MEEWKDIKGYEGLYQVSNEGRVKSVGRTIINKNGISYTIIERFIYLTKTPGGYLDAVLWKNNKPTHKLVHRLVYDAFIGSIPEGMQVNHIDENKENNHVENLNLMTPKENINYGSGVLRQTMKRSKTVYQYSISGELISTFTSASDAARKLGFGQGEISSCCRGFYDKNGKRYKRHTYKGYIWSYEPL